MPSARAEFTDTFMAESGIVNPMLEQAVREKLDAISDSYQFVLEAMGGIVIVTLSCLASRLRLA